MSTRKQTEIAIFAAAFANTLRDLDGNASYTEAEKATMAHASGTAAVRAYASGTAAVRAYEIACPRPKENLAFEDLPRPCVAQDADGDRLMVHGDGSWHYQESPNIGPRVAAQVWPASDPPFHGPFKIVEEG